MNRIFPIPIFLLFLLFLSREAQGQRRTSPHLSRAENTFRVADADRSGLLEAAELARAQISAESVRTWDADGDGRLSRDEFVVLYRYLLVQSGQVPGSGLEAEAQRIEGARAVEARLEAQRAGKDAAKGAREAEARGPSTAEIYRRARAALDERLKRNEGRSSPSRSAAGPAESLRSSLGRARSVVHEKAVEAGASRARVQHTQDSLNRRARQVLGDSYPTTLSPKEAEGVTASLRERLEEKLRALRDRARAAGWSVEQYSVERRRMLKRAKAAHLDAQQGEQESGEGPKPGPGKGKEAVEKEQSTTGEERPRESATGAEGQGAEG